MCPDLVAVDRRNLADFLATQPGFETITAEQVAAARTRDDLGLNSLQVILIMVNYLAATGGEHAFQPDWVARLEDVDGIASVMRDIDSLTMSSART